MKGIFNRYLKKLLVFLFVVGVGCVMGYSKTETASIEKKVKAVSLKSAKEEKTAIFSDSSFRNIVYTELSIKKNTDIEEVKKKMAHTKVLKISTTPSHPISSLDDLKYFTELETLYIDFYPYQENRIQDYSGIVQAPNLKVVYLENQNIDSLSFIKELPNLKELYLIQCDITDISELKGMVQLEHLSLYGNCISDITPLKGLEHLIELSLNENTGKIKDTKALYSLKSMQDLGLSNCGIHDIEFVRNMPDLRALNINNNDVYDLSPLEGHTKIERLGIRSNQLTDISVVKEMHKLYDLAVDDNDITDISCFTDLYELTSLGISDNDITDISVLSNKNKLFFVNYGRNYAKDITPLFHVPLVLFDESEKRLKKETFDWMKAAETWIEENYKELEAYLVEDISIGDLNEDGIMDVGIVFSDMYLKQNNKNTTKKEKQSKAIRVTEEQWEKYDYGESQKIVILLGKEEGDFQEFKTKFSIDHFYSGGIRQKTYRGLLIANGYLAIQKDWGNRERTVETTFYKYNNSSLKKIQMNLIYDDRGAVGYRVRLIKYPSEDIQSYAYALKEEYNYECVSLDEIDKLTGAPFFDLSEGGYYYFKELRRTNMTSEQALDKVFEELPIIQKKLKISVPQKALQRKKEIDYTTESKENCERLVGVKVPDYYYSIGNNKIILYYNNYKKIEDNWVHEIKINNKKSNEKTIYIRDRDGKIIFYK